MPLSGRNANVKITSLLSTSSTDIAATRSTGLGAGTTPGYVQVNLAAFRHLDDASTTNKLYLGAGLVASSLYALNPVIGRFTWLTGDPTTGVYTVDGAILTAASVVEARSWTLEVNQEMFEISHFGSSGWKTFMPDMAGAQITIGKYFNDSEFMDYIVLGSRFIVELHVDQAGNRFECYARPSSDQIQTAVGAILGESISLVADGPVYYSTL